MKNKIEKKSGLINYQTRPDELNYFLDDDCLIRNEGTSRNIKETITNIRQGIQFLDYTIHNDLDFCINGTESEEKMRDRVIQIQKNLYQWMNYRMNE